MTVKEILKILHNDGWVPVEMRIKGSHIQLKHPAKPSKITVPNHKGDLAPGTLNSILKQAGLK
jgi:predicted RNA binding protein YcfA (HicA-like mRNA interferase family)